MDERKLVAHGIRQTRGGGFIGTIIEFPVDTTVAQMADYFARDGWTLQSVYGGSISNGGLGFVMF